MMLRNTEVCSAKLKVIITYLPGLVLASFFFSILPLFQMDVIASSLLNVLEGAKAPNLNLFMRKTPDNLTFKDILQRNWPVCC